jgi:hypothetical protein
LAISFSVEAPDALYRIDRWHFKDYQLSLDVRPVVKGSETIFVQNVSFGPGGPNILRLEYGGLNWKRRATLMREYEFSARNQRLKAEIQGFEKAGQ